MAENPYPIQVKKRVLFALCYSLVLLMAFFLVIGTMLGEFFHVLMLSMLGMAVLSISLGIAYLWWYLRSLTYSLAKKELTFKGGVLSRFEKVIPYSKIQHVILYESFWQRVLGLSSVSVETARETITPTMYGEGTTRSTGPLIPNLNKKDAEALKLRLISAANKYKSIAGI